MTSSVPIPLLATHDVISGPVTSFPLPASIPCPTALGLVPPNSVPDLQNRPHGQNGHVGQIRLSDWLKFPMLRSDWSGAKPLPLTTRAVVPAMSAKPPGIFPRAYVSTFSVIGPRIFLNIYKILNIAALYALVTVSAS